MIQMQNWLHCVISCLALVTCAVSEVSALYQSAAFAVVRPLEFLTPFAQECGIVFHVSHKSKSPLQAIDSRYGWVCRQVTVAALKGIGHDFCHGYGSIKLPLVLTRQLWILIFQATPLI